MLGGRQIEENEDKTQEKQHTIEREEKTLEEKQAEYSAMRDEEVRRLNAAYDFNSIEGVNNIPVPCREVNGASTTGRVEYYLRGQCFFQHWEAGNIELALACLRKAQELMYVSNMLWRKTDFLHLVCYLYEAWKDDEAEKELERVNSYFAAKEEKQENFSTDIALRLTKGLQTDLVETSAWGPYCGECAKYINRVFSISGKDKRFPTLPREFFSNDGGHHLSCLQLNPFVYGSSRMHIKREQVFCVDEIEYSNRPFVDKRTQEEIDRYSNYCIAIQRHADEEAKRCDLMIKRALKKREDIQTLKWLSENLPRLCPKSLSGFRRMRTMNTNNYQKLVVEAEKLGRQI